MLSCLNLSQPPSPQWRRAKVRIRTSKHVSAELHANECTVIEEAAHECVSEEALVHLKSYKYSSVDKSLISNYILKHYVRTTTFTIRGRNMLRQT